MKIAPHNTRIYSWFNALHGFEPYSPIAILYFAGITGSYALAASIFSAAYVFQVLLEIPTGVLSDQVGRVRTVVLGAACNVLAVICFLIGGSYALLLIGALLQGGMLACFSGNNQALLFESCEQDGTGDYHVRMAKTESYFHYSATASAVLGGVLAMFSFRLAYAFSLLPAILALVVATKLTEPAKREHKLERPHRHIASALKHVTHNSKLRIIAAASSLEFGFGHALFNLQLAFVSTLWPLWALGVSRALSGLFASVSFKQSGRVIDRFGTVRTVVYSGVWGRAVGLLAVAVPWVGSPVIASASSLAFGSSTVAESTLQQEEFTSSQRATLGSITSVMGSLVYAVGSVLFGLLADHFGLRAALLCGAAPMLLATGLYATLLRK